MSFMHGVTWTWICGVAAGLWLSAGVVQAQTPESLPRSAPPFKGQIGSSYKDSIPDYPAAVTAPAGAPNVLIILLDDVGFGMTGTFGGPVPTPALDQLSASGVKYNRFHTTSLCSPTRAALLTGRNHHTAATGVIIEMGTGFPGYTGILPRETATVAQILQDNGYATSAFGKWHNTPELEISPSGPFDRWPTNLGFGTFYGFNQGETHQYHPTLYRDTSPVTPSLTAAEGYHFTTDMTDEAIRWVRNVSAAGPHRPWFCYFAPGACHAPHHAPRAWREKFRGQFDAGWDEMRKQIFAKQLQMKLLPADSVLTGRPPEIPAWDDLAPETRLIAARLMENYAGFMAHTDFEIGRLIDSLEENGQLDETLIFYIVGDNGASGEGGPEGTFNEIAALAGYNPGAAGFRDRVDLIGEPESEPHVPIGWAWAMNTPFQWTKQVASHFGGTRNPLVVHWPKGIHSQGELRSQFHHVVDLAPTILDVAGITEPTMVNGVPQKPMEGISLRYTFNDAAATDRRTTQYFEMMGNRAIYADGWFACARHGIPWITTGTEKSFEQDQWELYDLNADFTQGQDVATQNPQKLAELKEQFEQVAAQHQVLPLDDRLTQRLDPRLRRTGPVPTRWTYIGNEIRIPEAVSPIICPLPHQISLEISIPDKGTEGVIACTGGESGGWTIFLQDGKLHYLYNFFGYEEYAFTSPQNLPVGEPVQIQLEFIPNVIDLSKAVTNGGLMKFRVGKKLIGELPMSRTTYRHGIEPFEIGRDSVSPVSKRYAGQGTFPFTGTIHKVEFKLTLPFGL